MNSSETSKCLDTGLFPPDHAGFFKHNEDGKIPIFGRWKSHLHSILFALDIFKTKNDQPFYPFVFTM